MPEKKLEFWEFVKLIQPTPHLRVGQASMALLNRTRPDLYNRLTGFTHLDPFYDDKKLPTFFTWLCENWDK